MTLKDRLKKRNLTIGSWLTLSDGAITEMMARAGFDWLTVDMEHSAITLDSAQNMIRLVQGLGVEALVRVGENDYNLIKRVMDTGADGVIVPMINTAGDAVKAVEAVKYPPAGKRGCGLARAQKYGADFKGYKKWCEERSVVIAQIESRQAADNFDEILDVPGIDAFIIGPYDLSGTLGMPGRFDRPEFKRYMNMIADKARRKKAVLGIHVIPPEKSDLERAVKKGFKFIAFSLDTLFLQKGLNAFNDYRDGKNKKR
jgi:2-dehydro-3-deoxyglucarate aldolase